MSGMSACVYMSEAWRNLRCRSPRAHHSCDGISHWTRTSLRAAGQWIPGIWSCPSPILPLLGLQAHPTMSSFPCRFQGSNTDPHTWQRSTLLHKPPPKSHVIIIMHFLCPPLWTSYPHMAQFIHTSMVLPSISHVNTSLFLANYQKQF